MDKVNLWNVYGLNVHKTRNVVNYITELQEPGGESIMARRKFHEIKKEALAKITPDAMLERIGYNLDGKDRIYEECTNEGKRR